MSAAESPPASFDLIAIGAGPAGRHAALEAARLGARVLVVERERAVGGECVHRGTIPSKTLRETAVHLAGLERRSGGVLDRKLPPEMQLQSLMQRLDDVLSGQELQLGRQLEEAGVAVWTGSAGFVDEHTLSVVAPDGRRRLVRGGRILIATGSRPRVPAGIPVDHEHVLDSDSILSLIYLPRSLAVLGGGVIACEFASVFAALGVEVTMIDRADRALGFLDAELVEHFLDHLDALGGRYLPQRRIDSIAPGLGQVTVALEGGETLRAEKVLCALGREANLRGLNLEAAGLEATDRGHVPVDDNFRTAAPSVYAAGDVVGPPALASCSEDQGRRAARHALDAPLPARGSLTPMGIYTIPEMSTVGLDEADALRKHGACLVGRAHFADLARGRINAQENGVLKLVTDVAGRRLLGAQVVGEGACELIHVAQMALLADFDVDVFVEQTFNFPTLAEAFRVAARDVIAQRGELRATA